MFIYSLGNQGNFPPNAVLPKAKYWYDYDRLGYMFAPQSTTTSPPLTGRIVTCPEDVGGQRSYAMNVWASSFADTNLAPTGYGTLWKPSQPYASRYILVAEKWSSVGSAAGWTASATLGGTKDTPGRRFGGGPGISPLLVSGHFGQANCELPYQRHRLFGGFGQGTQPYGRVNIGYADGHVAQKSNADLVNPGTALSTLDSWWSPLDRELNN